MYSEVFSVTMAGLEAVIVNVETDAGDVQPDIEEHLECLTNARPRQHT